MDAGPVFLTAEWRWLLMLNFAIEPAALRRHTPRGTELDTWHGTTYVSLVAFQFLQTKVKGMPIPFHRNFEEINLRFYVRFRGPDGWRRGVVFIREVVPKIAIALVARWLYNENYVACATRCKFEPPSTAESGCLEYGWKHAGAWLSIGARLSGEPAYPADDSEEAFISEHYWGYSTQRDGGTTEYRVEHPQWRVWNAADISLRGDFAGFYGAEFGGALASQPASSFVADGSTVLVRSGHRIDRANNEIQ